MLNAKKKKGFKDTFFGHFQVTVEGLMYLYSYELYVLCIMILLMLYFRLKSSPCRYCLESMMLQVRDIQSEAF